MKTKPRSIIELLEARISPAALTFGPALTTYAATDGEANTFTIAVVGANYTFTDSAETISLNQAAITAGFTGNNTNTITAPLAAFDAGALLLIALGDGDDTLNVNGLRHSLSLSNDAGADTATIATGATAVNGSVTISAETTTLTSLNGAAGLTVSADTLTVSATIGVTGPVLVQQITSGRQISLGTEIGTFLSLTATEVSRLASGTSLQIGNTSSGNISLSAALSLGSVELSLKTGGGIAGATGSIVAGALAIDADASVVLTGANNVATLAALVSDAGADFSFTDATGFQIGTVDGIAGLTTAVPSTLISLNAGSVTQAAGANIFTASLQLLGAGPFNLPNTGNDVASLSANIGGSLTYTDSDTLSIDITGGTQGITTSNDNVTISTVNGALNVLNGDGDATPDIDIGSGVLSISAGGVGTTDRALAISANAGIVATGGVTLIADNITLSAAINAGTSIATLAPFQAGTLIALGGADAANTLGLTDTELDLVTAGRVIVGNTTSGNLNLAGPINLAGTPFLSLRSGAAITDTFGVNIITETSLTLEALSGIGAPSNAIDTAVTNLEAQTTTGGISIIQTGALRIGGIDDALPGLSVLTSGDLVLTTSGTLTVGDLSGTESVKGGTTSGGVSLTANGATSDITATTGNEAVIAPGGSITLTAGRDILFGVGGFDHDVLANGGVLFTAGRDVVVDGAAAVRSDDFGNDTGGSVSIGAGRNITITGNSSSVSAGGSAGGDVTLTTGVGGRFNHVSDFATGLNSNSGDITVNADRIAIGATANITAPSGAVTLRPATAGHAIDLGSVSDFTAAVELSDAELDRIISGSLTISGGAITLTAPITLGATVPVLSLISTGGIALGAGGSIGVASLYLEAASAISLGGGTPATDVGTLAGKVTTSGTFGFSNSDGFTVGTVAGFSGISNANGSILLTAATGDITLAAPITSPTPGNIIAPTATSGAILDGNGAALNFTSTNLVLRATAGIGTTADPLEASVEKLAFTNLGSTPVAIANSATLIIAPLAGITASTNPGGLTTLTTSLLTIASAGALAANGTVTGPISLVPGGNLFPAHGPGVLTTTGLTLASGSSIVATFAGTAPGTSHDQIVVNGPVTLGSADFSLLSTFTPAPGDTFTLIANDGTDPITGTFLGLPEGTVLNSLFVPQPYRISYTGGDGNDLTLTPVFSDLVISPTKRNATYTDVDGDIVTFTISKGALSKEDFTLVLSGTLGGSQLQTLNLSDDSGEFKNANLTLSAATPGGGGGDGFVNVGLIDSTGSDLGKVKVSGDLGRILVGDGDVRKPALLKLKAGTLGLQGTSTQTAGGNISSVINGDVAKLTVLRGITNASLLINGKLTAASITGGIDASTGSAEAGFIDVTKSIGTIAILGDLTGGAAFSGISAGRTLGTLTISGDLSSANPAFPVLIRAFGAKSQVTTGIDLAIGTLDIGGSVTNANILAGYSRLLNTFNADASIGTIKVGGDFTISTIHAGTGAGNDGFSGTADDVKLESLVNPRDAAGVFSQIAKIVIGGQAFGSNAPTTDSFGILAEKILSAKVNGTALPFTATPGEAFFPTLTGPGQGGAPFDFAIREIIPV